MIEKLEAKKLTNLSCFCFYSLNLVGKRSEIEIGEKTFKKEV